MLAYSTGSSIQLYLPSSIALLYLVVQIRDKFDCVTEFNLSAITVRSNLSAIEYFIDTLQESINNSHTIGQMIISISEVFNEMNEQIVHFLPDSISSLHDQISNTVSFYLKVILINIYLNRYLIQQIR
jgi:hypothetical protein